MSQMWTVPVGRPRLCTWLAFGAPPVGLCLGDPRVYNTWISPVLVNCVPFPYLSHPQTLRAAGSPSLMPPFPAFVAEVGTMGLGHGTQNDGWPISPRSPYEAGSLGPMGRDSSVFRSPGHPVPGASVFLSFREVYYLSVQLTGVLC